MNIHNLHLHNGYIGYPLTEKPIAIIVTNSSNKPTACKLFFGDESYNFGNPDCINIDTIVVNSKYGDVVSYLNKNVFRSSLLRLQSDNTAQVKKLMRVMFNKITGIPIISASYTESRIVSDINDIAFNLIIDKYVYLTTTILPKTTLKLMFFPSQLHSDTYNFKDSKEFFMDFKGFIKKCK